jgi:membrane protein implicated in regulation of membrane protease activity
MFALFKSNQSSPRQKLNPWQGQAIVDDAIAPHQIGRVRFRGSYWNARCDRAIAFSPGDAVKVVGIGDNLVLLVEPQA